VDKALETIYRQIVFTRDYQNLGVAAPFWQHLPALFQEYILHNLPENIEFSQKNCGYFLYADGLLGRVFGNLLDNSIRHGERVTRIMVNTCETESTLLIRYIDNGVGISDAMKEKIFERGVGSHTGYGLFLVREILSLTKITIREIGIPGEGVIFEMSVPKGLYEINESVTLPSGNGE
jgi:signal transduction histidine kinase